jgi:hypothetical protein
MPAHLAAERGRAHQRLIKAMRLLPPPPIPPRGGSMAMTPAQREQIYRERRTAWRGGYGWSFDFDLLPDGRLRPVDSRRHRKDAFDPEGTD